jgi:hypothetical protein
VNELSNVAGTDARIFAPLHFNQNLISANGVSNRGYLLPKLSPKFFRIALMAGTFFARKSINTFHPDILHETYFSLDGYCPVGAKRVLTVYDMIHEKYADAYLSGEALSNPERKRGLFCILWKEKWPLGPAKGVESRFNNLLPLESRRRG